MNRFITYCITSCEQNDGSELLTHHRLVRMVCVFFTTLMRVKNFDVKVCFNYKLRHKNYLKSIKKIIANIDI